MLDPGRLKAWANGIKVLHVGDADPSRHWIRHQHNAAAVWAAAPVYSRPRWQMHVASQIVEEAEQPAISAEENQPPQSLDIAQLSARIGHGWTSFWASRMGGDSHRHSNQPYHCLDRRGEN